MNEIAHLNKEMERFNASALSLQSAYTHLVEKLSRMYGRLAEDVAHEIRNPLGSIQLFASLLMKDLTDERNRRRAALIMEAAQSVEHAIAGFLRAVKLPQSAQEYVDIHALLREILQGYRQMADGEGIFLRTRYAPVDFRIGGETEMLRQVLLNLLCHSLQAIGEGGCLLIETKFLENDYRRGVSVPSLELCLTLERREGAVRSPSAAASFFRGDEKGMGLGLAIINGIAQRYRGSVHFALDESGDTVFSIIFPVMERDL